MIRLGDTGTKTLALDIVLNVWVGGWVRIGTHRPPTAASLAPPVDFDTRPGGTGETGGTGGHFEGVLSLESCVVGKPFMLRV